MNKEETFRDISERYQSCSSMLNERQRRIWAAREAVKIGRGGIALVSRALRMSPNTIKRGIQDLTDGDADQLSGSMARVRRVGGGRKRKES